MLGLDHTTVIFNERINALQVVSRGSTPSVILSV